MTKAHSYVVSAALAMLALLALAPIGHASQAEEHLSPSVATVLTRSIADRPPPGDYASPSDVALMARSMSPRG